MFTYGVVNCCAADAVRIRLRKDFASVLSGRHDAQPCETSDFGRFMCRLKDIGGRETQRLRSDDTHDQRAKAAGATIVIESRRDDGGRGYSCRDRKDVYGISARMTRWAWKRSSARYLNVLTFHPPTQPE